MTRSWSPFTLMLVVLLLVLGACTADGVTDDTSGDEPADGSPPTTDASADSDGSSGTLTAATGTIGQMTWTPHESGNATLTMGKLMADSLLTLDQEGQVVPMLAESWDVSDDGQTWTFNLRPDVKFHGDWGTLTSEDVKYTWQEWMREDSNQTTGPQLNEALGGDIDNFEIVDDLEFVLHLPQPDFDLHELVLQFNNGLQVTSKRYHEESPETAATHPIYTGPWEFVSGIPGAEIVMAANQDYWGHVPEFAELVVKEIPDGAARLVQVEGGSVDIATLDGSLIPEAEAAGIEIASFPDIATLFVLFGGMYYGDEALDEDSPWIQADNPEQGLAIREAMSLAIDRELILDTILGGYGEVVYKPFMQSNANPNTMDPSWTLPAYDPDAARQKLAEGGYPDGFPVTVFLYQDEVDTVGVGEAIAGMWEKIGLDVTREPSEEDLLDPLLDEKTSDGLVWVKMKGFDPPTISLNQYGSHRTGDFKLIHPAIDEAIANYAATGDPEVKAQVLRDMVTALGDDVAMIPLFEVDLPLAVGPRVGDWAPIPGDKELNQLHTVTLADD